MPITKGVIAAAGRGTRFLPATKVIPKELIPIIDKPIIQYIVEEFVAAGIKEIIIVTRAEEGLIKNYFSASTELEEYLKQTDKMEELKRVRAVSELAHFTFVEQQGPYGNGTPVLNAKALLGGEPFVYAFGDDLVLARESFTKSMIDSWNRQPGIYVGVQEVGREEVSKYGIAEVSPGSNQVLSLIEKPEASSAPSRLAVFGRYILDADIFAALNRIEPGKGGELWIVDAVADLIDSGKKVYCQKIKDGRWFTTGDPQTYFEALEAYAKTKIY